MTNLLSIYEEIYSYRQEYCVICLRSGHERRMVDIKNLELFVKSINLPFNYYGDDLHHRAHTRPTVADNTLTSTCTITRYWKQPRNCRVLLCIFLLEHFFQRVCWVCERAATAAYRMRLAFNLSCSVHSLFALMDRSVQRHKDVAAQLKGKKKPMGIVRQAFEWQTRLEAVRARSTLLHTEVLVVASVPPSQGVTSRPESPPDESNVYLIPDAPPPREPSPPPAEPRAPPPPPPDDALCEPEIFMDSVIIEDDERDPIEIKPEPAADTTPRRDTPCRTMTHTTTRATTTASSPMLGNLQNPSIVGLDTLLQEENNTSFLLHPIVENNGVISVPSLNAQIINGQLMTINKSNFVIQTPKLVLHNGSNLNLLTEPSQVTTFLKTMNKNDLTTASIISDDIPFHLLQNNMDRTASRGQQSQSQSVVRASQGSVLPANPVLRSQDMQALMTGKPFVNNNVITHSIIIEDEDVPEDGQRRTDGAGARQGETDAGRRKRDRDKQSDAPPKKQRETDWEDKIPMDVISYVGAIDPNADSLLTREPPLGVISAVHSVSEEAHRDMNNVQLVNSVQPGITCSQLEINSAQPGINSAQPGINSAQTGINSAQPGINICQTGRNTVQSGLSSVNSGIKGATSVQSGSSSKQASGATLTPVTGVVRTARASCSGSGRGSASGSVHQNVFPGQGPGAGAGAKARAGNKLAEVLSTGIKLAARRLHQSEEC